MIKELVKKILLTFFELGKLFSSITKILLFSNIHFINWCDIRVNEKECVVLGNGPSLKKTLDNYFEFINKKRIICVANFIHSDYFVKLQPEYYVMVDDSLWSKKASRRIKEQYKKIYSEMKNNVKWKMTLFMPMWAARWNFFQDLPNDNENIKIKYINTTPIFCYDKIRYLFYKANLAMPQAENVLIAAIFIALNIGFKKVFVFGADHSWHETLYVGDNNVLYYKDSHFYDNDKVALIPILETPREKKVIKIDQQFASLARAFSSHLVLNSYAKYIGARVLNASGISYIDAYKRYKVNGKQHKT